MAEYLHLYTETPAGVVETDINLRGSTYRLDDRWTPVSIDPAVDLDAVIVSEVMTLNVLNCADATAVADAISALRQVLYEAKRRHDLARYPHTRTYLRRYPHGGAAADYRTAEVVGGAVERVLAFGQREIEMDSADWGAIIQVRIDHRVPLGVAETLKNLVVNESFEYDTDSNGLANNWTEFGTAGNQKPSITAVSNEYGRYGQTLTLNGNANDTGIKSAAITVTAETQYTLKAWVDATASTTAFRVEVYDATNSAYVTTSMLTFALGSAGALQSVNFTTPAGCVSVEVRAYWSAGINRDVVVVDGIYLGLTGTYAPQGWSSYYLIQNHEDGAANSTDHNWVHVTDIPGDVDAIIENEIKVTAGGSWNILLCARRTDEGVWLAPLWLDASTATGLVNVVLTTDADGTGPASNNVGNTTPGSGGATGIMTWAITTDGLHVPLRGLYRLLFRLRRTAGTNGSLTITSIVQAGTSFTFDTQTFTVNNAAFAMARGPVIRIPPTEPLQLYTESSLSVVLRLVGGGDSYYVDGLRLLPVDEELGDFPDLTDHALINDTYIIMSGYDATAVALNTSGDYTPVGSDEGLVTHLEPGRPQRLYYVVAYDDGTYDPADWLNTVTAKITLSVRPRYLSL